MMGEAITKPKSCLIIANFRGRIGVLLVMSKGSYKNIFCQILFFIFLLSSTGFCSSDILFSEDEIINNVLHALKNEHSGARSFMFHKKIVFINSSDLVRKTVEQNSDIKIAKLIKDISDNVLHENHAVFDPFFRFSISYTHTDQNQRQDRFYRRHEISLDDENFAWIGQVEVDEIEYYINEYNNVFQTSWIDEYAISESHPPYLPGTWTGALSLTKSFSWGQEMELVTQSNYNKVEYPSIGQYSLFYFNENKFPYENNPWTSSLSFSLTSSMPLCKNFGIYGSLLSVQCKLLRINTQMAKWQEQSDIIAFSAKTQLGYWNLVQNLQHIRMLSEHISILTKLSMFYFEMVQKGEKSIYGSTQLRAKLIHLTRVYETAWNYYILNSNKLAALLGVDTQKNIMVPINYMPRLHELRPFSALDLEKMTNQLLNEHPDLLKSRSAIKSSRIWYQYQKNQNSPDLSLSLSLSLSQVNTFYGYPSWTESFRNILNPDSSSVYVGIRYVFPVGNKAVKARLNHAKIKKKQQVYRQKLFENQLLANFDAAISNLKSSNLQLDKAKKNFELKRYAYHEALEIFKDQEITEFEFIEKHDDLLEAKYKYLVSKIQCKKSYIQLQASRGILLE